MAMRLLLRRSSCGSRRPARQTGIRLSSLALVPALTLLAAMLAVVPSATAGVLDQSQPVIEPAGRTFGDKNRVAQTFTSGITGVLDQVDLAIVREDAGITDHLLIEIRPVSSGVPSGPALASESVPPASLPPAFPQVFFSVSLSPPAPVTAGVQYAIVASSANCGTLDCYNQYEGPAGDPYPAGTGLESLNAGATWTPIPFRNDLPFKTYVATRPTSKAQCKKGGWKRFTNPSFKNQGQCVAYVNHHDDKGKDDQNSSQGKGDQNNSQGEKKGHGKK